MSQGQACCDVVNHGGAYAEGKFFFNALDGRTFALDARTGRELWRAKLANPAAGEGR
jgi:alcohol dehydrogenase (cytochrome c)